MKRTIAIGTSNFKKIRENNNYYVDKSMFIKEIVEDGSEVVLLPRPRRFGKTLNMTMLRYFFDKNNAAENRKLFEGLKIASDEVFDREQGKYPVIYLSFKDITEVSFEGATDLIRNELANLFESQKSFVDFERITNKERNDFLSICDGSASLSLMRESIKILTHVLFTSFKIKPIIIIDEYDTPIHHSYTNHFYDEMITFMRGLLGSALKDNDSLHKGIITGTLRISKESIFTGLNNPSVYTLLNSNFNDKFGFTQEEVSQMLVDFGLDLEIESVRQWYNGYIIGGVDIYNPWSIINFVHNHQHGFKPYWINTSSNDLIKEIIKTSPYSLQTQIKDLLDDKPIVKTLNENISFPDLKNSDDAIYSFFVFSGYLKASFVSNTDKGEFYELSIPNLEVKRLFNDIILLWFKETFRNDRSTLMLNALFEKDTELFGEILNECVLNSFSAFDVEKRNPERVYQAFLLGLLVSLGNEYEVTSNRESGYGRYDICIIPLDGVKPCIVMELKQIRISETVDTALSSALDQIERLKYETSIRQRGYSNILKLAVVFDGKRVWVRS